MFLLLLAFRPVLCKGQCVSGCGVAVFGFLGVDENFMLCVLEFGDRGIGLALYMMHSAQVAIDDLNQLVRAVPSKTAGRRAYGIHRIGRIFFAHFADGIDDG